MAELYLAPARDRDARVVELFPVSEPMGGLRGSACGDHTRAGRVAVVHGRSGPARAGLPVRDVDLALVQHADTRAGRCDAVCGVGVLSL